MPRLVSTLTVVGALALGAWPVLDRATNSPAAQAGATISADGGFDDARHGGGAMADSEFVAQPGDDALSAFARNLEPGSASMVQGRSALSLPCTRTPVLIDLEETVLQSGGDAFGTAVDIPSVCGSYEVVMVSGDRRHRTGFQKNQTAEQWRAEFLNSTGAVIDGSGPTADLVGDQTIATTTGRVEFAESITSVRVRHVGPAGVVNDVEAIALVLLPTSTTMSCEEQLTTVLFEGPRLLSGEEEVVEFDAASLCLCSYQWVVAVSQDVQHKPRYQTDQTRESWSLAALGAGNRVVAETGLTEDLPDERWAGVDILALDADLFTDGIALAAKHPRTSGPESIDPVAVVFAPR